MSTPERPVAKSPSEELPAKQTSVRVGWSLFVFGLSLALFLVHAAPGLTFEDSGALATAAATSGVPHPPGYPLWTLLGRAWIALLSPAGFEVARALNLLSAFCAAGAAGLLTHTMLRLGSRPGAAVATGLLAVASATFAAQAAITEVYAPAALLQVALLCTALTARKPLRKACLLFGLCLAAHQASLLMAPLLLWAWLRERRAGSRGMALGSWAMLLPGLALYAYLPIAAAQDPALNWGEVTSLQAFWEHVSRVQFRTGIERVWENQLGFLLEQMVGQWPFALLLSALCLAAFRSSIPRAALSPICLCTLSLALGLLWGVNYPLGDPAAKARLAGSYTPLILCVSLLCGLGLSGLEVRLGQRLRARSASAVVLVATLLACELGGPQTLRNERDKRRDNFAQEFGVEVLNACPKDAVLIINQLGFSDVTHFPLLYLQEVHQLRRDVLILNRDLLPLAWYQEQLARRHPELLIALEHYALVRRENPKLQIDPRGRRILNTVFFHQLFEQSSRPMVFLDKPSERLLGEHFDVQPGRVLWHLHPRSASPAAIDGPAAGEWLPEMDRNPWTQHLRELARRRDRARAVELETAGLHERADELRRLWNQL